MYLKDSLVILSYFVVDDISKIILLLVKNYYYLKIDYFVSFFLWLVILGISRVIVFVELKGDIYKILIYSVYILNNV